MVPTEAISIIAYSNPFSANYSIDRWLRVAVLRACPQKTYMYQLVCFLRQCFVHGPLAPLYLLCDGALLAVCRAFQNSRSLAQQGAPLLLLSILKKGNVSDAVTVAAVCGAAKKLAANEEICKELADDGAVEVTMRVCILPFDMHM